jgi:hypothetical protein
MLFYFHFSLIIIKDVFGIGIVAGLFKSVRYKYTIFLKCNVSSFHYEVERSLCDIKQLGEY